MERSFEGEQLFPASRPTFQLRAVPRLENTRPQAEADAATLSKEIAGLDEDISVWEGDKKASTEVGCAFSAAQSQYPGD